MKTYKCQIKDLGLVITGNTPPTKQREYYGDKVPLIKPTDMDLEKRFIGKTEESLSDFGIEKFRTKLLPKNTPCVVTIGTIGKLCMTKEISLCNQAVNSIIVDENRHDSMFVYYLMKMTVPHVKFLSSGTASGRENVSKTAFSSIEVEVPDLPIQRKIAGILSAYDDLIENNTRRIEILEEMARMLYREWFVKFRFPVDRGKGDGDRPSSNHPVELVESELGLIPKGWEVKKLGDYIRTQKGYAFKSTWYQENGIKIVKVSNFTNDSININDLVCISEDIAEKYKKYEISSNEIIIQTVGSWASNPQSVVGKVIKVPETASKSLLNQNAVKVIPLESINQSFLYYSLKNDEFKNYIINCAQGAASQASITLDAIKEFKIILPKQSIMKSFDLIINLKWKLINNLMLKNINLRKTRDLLLPRLISGEIDVEELDINLGAIEP